MDFFSSKHEVQKRFVPFPQGGWGRFSRGFVVPCALFSLTHLAVQADPPELASDLNLSQSALDLRPLEGEKTASTGYSDGNITVAAAEPVSLSTESLASDARALPPTVPPELASTTPQPLTGPAPGPASSSVPDASDASSATPPATENAMVNLINLLVAQHVIAPAAGDKLIHQATDEAAHVHQQFAAARSQPNSPASPNSDFPPPNPVVSAGGGSSDDEVQVHYVPDIVKNQIRDEVEVDLEKQAQEGKLQTQQDNVPDWVKRLHLSGDVRVRFEGDMYPSGNAGGENYTNFNSINTGAPFNFGQNNPNFPPSYNVNQDRDRMRLRARIGMAYDLGQNFTVGMRAGTGSDDNPVSENQTLGGGNSAQGGYFGKYQLWLDRAFIRYELGGDSGKDISFTVGRFDNPFMHTSMIWSDDLAMDGAVVQGKYAVGGGVTPFLTAGAFPVFNTDLNFATNQPDKFDSEDKWLYAAQGGVDWKISKDVSAKVAVAYYYFDNIEGKVSDPFIPQSASDIGDTDDSRPSFAQNGNTYIALRDITPDSSNGFGTTNQYQYFGLATPFHDLALTGQVDYSGFDPFHVWLVGEFVKNLAFDRNAILNNGPSNALGPQNNIVGDDYEGGDLGWIVRLNAGKVDLQSLWDWNVQLSYRYVESDATVDAFTDSDFGGSLAGTNLKGFIVGGNLALSPRVWLGLRYMSADSVAGPVYHSDLFQVDLNAKF